MHLGNWWKLSYIIGHLFGARTVLCCVEMVLPKGISGGFSPFSDFSNTQFTTSF